MPTKENKPEPDQAVTAAPSPAPSPQPEPEKIDIPAQVKAANKFKLRSLLSMGSANLPAGEYSRQQLEKFFADGLVQEELQSEAKAKKVERLIVAQVVSGSLQIA